MERRHWYDGATRSQGHALSRGAARKATLTRNAYCAALCRETLISNFPVPIAPIRFCGGEAGATPPVEQLTQFDLVIKLRAAKAIGMVSDSIGESHLRLLV